MNIACTLQNKRENYKAIYCLATKDTLNLALLLSQEGFIRCFYRCTRNALVILVKYDCNLLALNKSLFILKYPFTGLILIQRIASGLSTNVFLTYSGALTTKDTVKYKTKGSCVLKLNA